MGRKVFLSFLGKNPYSEVEYTLNGKTLSKTKFAQVAEIEYHGRDFFDKIIIAVTKSSKEMHFDDLQKEIGIVVEMVGISEDLTPGAQWEGIEKIISKIIPGDELYLDLTHGFRSIPIMFSIAVNFLQQIQNIELMCCYYAVYDKPDKPIVDFKEFFMINRWADAVSRLVENADAKKLAQVAIDNNSFRIADLDDPEIIDSFNKLTDAIRNVDVNHISNIASHAVGKILAKKQECSSTERILLDMVVDKFCSLTTEEPLKGEYDEKYFEMQLKIIKVLVEHKLFMQAFTAMRELVVSIAEKEAKSNCDKMLAGLKSKSRKKWNADFRRRLAEPFIGMVTRDRSSWNFERPYDPEGMRYLSVMEPVYSKYEKQIWFDDFKNFVKELKEIRNGFDHAWIGRAEVEKDIEQKAIKYLETLKIVLKNIYLEMTVD